MQNDFGTTWRAFRDALADRNRRLTAEIGGVWNDLSGLQSRVAEEFHPSGHWDWTAGEVAACERLFREHAGRLVIGPVDRFRQLRPLYRLLAGLDDWRAGVHEALQTLPSALEIRPEELREVLAPDADSAFWSRAATWRRGNRALNPRSWARATVQRHTARNTLTFGQILLYANDLTIGILDPWLEVRGKALLELLGQQADDTDFDRARGRWAAENRSRQTMAAASMDLMAQRIDLLPAAIANSILSGLFRDPPGTRKSDNFIRRAFEFWTRSERAVEGLLDLAVEDVRVGRDCIDEINRSLESVRKENEALVAEVDACIQAIETSQIGELSSLPPSSARPLPAEERAEYFHRALRHAAAAHLPLEQEAVDPRHVTPPLISPWKRIKPRYLFERALQSQSLVSALPGFSELSSAHQAILRDTERAREVVEFAAAEARRLGPEGAQLFAEGLENALTLLRFRREASRWKQPLVARGMLEGVCYSFAQYWAAIERGRFGQLSVRARRAAYYFAGSTFRSGKDLVHEVSTATIRRLRHAYHWSLIRIGWEFPSSHGDGRVQTYGFLSSSLNINFQAKQLPMIYRRLFRLAPVEDPRFLIGRELEMQALSDARDLWQSGHAVSVLLVGGRGSGKTSLLNCAQLQVFAGTALHRFQIQQRLINPGAMTSFLRHSLGLPKDADLLAVLREEPRVIVLEEVERAYLRTIGGMAAIKELLTLIVDTAGRTLWIVAINQDAFRLLRAAVRFDEFFSHRIEATSVTAENIREAILQRHNLSGLRLEFTTGSRTNTHWDRIRRLIGVEEDPEQAFFRKLFAQSSGLFRSAFELWQRYIDRAEAGTLYIGKPEPPRYQEVLSGLSRVDLFTLQAIVQHGNLTVAEHTEVFHLNPHESRVRLERLINREILEHEPDSDGWRVRPEAAYLVRSALSGENLI